LHGQEAFGYTDNMPNKSHIKKSRRKKADNGWKDLQSRRQTSKKTKLGLIVFGIILLLFLLSQAVKFTHMLFSPWKEPITVKKTVLWNGKFNINVVIKAKNISLLSFDPSEQKAVIYDIPENTYLEVSSGFGKWQLSSIYDFGESQKNMGGVLLKGTMESLFGLPIDGVLNFSGKYSQKEVAQIISEIRKSPLSITNAMPFLKTNLTPFELIKLSMGLSGVRFDKVKQVNLLDTPDLLTKNYLPDGTEVLIADTVKLDSIISLTDAVLKSENKTIAIFNSTSHPGLAQKAARLITNIGGDVIITSNGQNEFKKTLIVGEKSKTLDRLKQIFEANDIIDLKESKDLVSSRAQINLFLGEDYFDSL